MALPFIFANSTSGKQPAANLDTNFAAVALNTVIPATATGTAAIVLTPNTALPNSSPTIAAYFDRVTLSFVMPANSTGPVTIAIAGLTAKIAYKGDASAQLDAGDLKAASLYTAVYSSALAGGVGGFYVIGGPGTPGATGPVGPIGPVGPVGPVGPGGPGTPGGVATQVQFNDGASLFGGDTEFTYDKTTNILSVSTVALSADPTSALQAATKQYVDARVASSVSAATVGPGGRLTFTAATPVMTANVTAGNTIYYTPYLGGYVPVFDGTAWSLLNTSTDISQLTTDATKSPAAVVANSIYDLFVWNDAGTPRLSRGPAWTSATVRSLALSRQNGIWVNASAITNGPLATRGTWVGTFLSNASATATWVRGSANSGGTQAASFNVWNASNRVDIKTMVADITGSWSYNSVFWRAANNQTGNRVGFVTGLDEDGIEATYRCAGASAVTASSYPLIGVGVDSAATPTGVVGVCPGTTSGSATASSSANFSGRVPIGSHFIAAIEASSAGGASAFYGLMTIGGTIQVQAMALSVSLKM